MVQRGAEWNTPTHMDKGCRALGQVARAQCPRDTVLRSLRSCLTNTGDSESTGVHDKYSTISFKWLFKICDSYNMYLRDTMFQFGSFKKSKSRESFKCYTG